MNGAVVVPNDQAAVRHFSPTLPPPSRPRRSSPRRRRAFRRRFATPITPTGVRASALPGGPSATTRPSCAAAGDASSRRRWASRWSPAGPSTPVIVATYNQAIGKRRRYSAALLQQSRSTLAAGSATGTAGFDYAFPIHYKDPTVQQWNLTVEQDLGHSIGVRLSYTGSHGQNLEAMVDLNQVPANTIGYDQAGRPTVPIPPGASFRASRMPPKATTSSGTVEVSPPQRQGHHLRRQLHLHARPLQCRRGHAQRLRRRRRQLSHRPLSSRPRLRQRDLRPQAPLPGHLPLRPALRPRPALAQRTALWSTL